MKPLNLLRKFRGNDRGTTFLEVMATITMISVASVGTTYSLFFANGKLREDMHRQQVARMVQQEIEYWVGRIYLGGGDALNPEEMQGSGGTVPYRTALLDPDSKEPITVKFFYDPIVGRGSNEGSTLPAYYVLTVWAEWMEPGGKWFKKNLGSEVSFTTYVVPGGISG